MNTKAFTALLLIIFPACMFAQIGNLRTSAGFPLGWYEKKFDHDFPESVKTDKLGFVIQLEKKWKPEISVGTYIGYARQEHELDLGFDEIRFNYYRGGALLTYELNNWLSRANLSLGHRVDIYTSAKTGFAMERKRTFLNDLDAKNVPIKRNDTSVALLFDLGATLGARYHLSNQLGIFSELGWGNSRFFTVGVFLD